MTKLLQINITANWGSHGKIAEGIGNIAISHGWDSYIAYGRWFNPSKSHLFHIGNMLDERIHGVMSRLFDIHGLMSKYATKQLITYIEKINPDIIHLHNIHGYYLNYPILFKFLAKTNKPIVWTLHDCWAFTGHCYHFVQQACMKWQTECCNCPQRNRFIDRSQENFNLKKSMFIANQNLTIVPCSEWMGDFVRKSFLKDKRIQVIHNGVDLNTFKVIPGLKKKDGKFRILAVSNVWLAYKGYYDIFKLREMLSDEYEITMVGLKEKQLTELPAGIRGITRTQNVHQLVELYNEADVLINPTYADTFPTVNLEALACGTSVITYRTGGSPEAVDEKTGIVVEQGDVDALADAIRKMKEHPLSSEDCRKRAEEHFDKDKCFEKYINLYNTLLVD